jgi:type II secretory pathway pseudopilin PulG
MKADGFSLVEVLVATSLVVVAVLSLAQLFGTSTERMYSARTSTVAVLLAQQKLEELRRESVAFVVSPSDTLRADTPGYVDYVDGRGVSTINPFTPPPFQSLYTRRWSVEPIFGTEAVVLQVVVLPGRVHLVTVKTRKAG